MSPDSTEEYDTLVYDSDAGAYRTGFGPDGDPPSIALLKAMSAITDRGPLELDRLEDTVDGNALDRLFARPTPGGCDGRVSFVYHDHEITVHCYGLIWIVPPDDRRPDGGEN